MVAEERGVSGVALVTGAARGIGLEVARRGMTVVLGARDAEKGEAAAGELTEEGLDSRARTLDVGTTNPIGRA